MKRLFVGPGHKLIVPYEMGYYSQKDCPICKADPERAHDSFPHTWVKTAEIPYGFWWDSGEYPQKPKLLGAATSDEIANALRKLA